MPFKKADSITDKTLPHAMIDGIRRRLGKPVDRSLWDTEQELRPERSTVSDLHADATVLVATTRGAGQFVPEGSTDYCKTLVSSAIENGGKLGGHQIPVPWLRMILAGLELRQVEPGMMWNADEVGNPASSSVAEGQSFDDLFPS